MKKQRIILLFIYAIFFMQVKMYAAGGGTYFFSSSTQRTVLIEQFTNASCNPCASENAIFNPKLLENISKISVVKYQVSWPGTDPMYNYNKEASQARVDYYGVQGVPYATMDGVEFNINDFSAALVDNAAKKLSYFEIFGADKKSGDSVEIFVSIENLITISAGEGDNLRLFVIVTEEPILYTTAPGTNGEKEFHFVMRKMISGNSGLAIGGKTANEVTNYNFSYVIDNPLKSENLKTAIFIQNIATKEILQSISYYSSEPRIGLGPDIHVSNDNPVELKIYRPAMGGIPPYTYSWSPLDGLSSIKDTIVTADPLVNTKYFLTITDSTGKTAVDSILIRKDVCPTSDFSFTRAKGSKNVNFDASPSKDWSICKWIFHDGSIVNGYDIKPQVAKTYPDYGSYQVKLIVFSACGSDTITKQVGIWGVGVQEEIASGNLKINVIPYPQTNNFILNVESQKPVAFGLRISNVFGQIIKEKSTKNYPSGKSTIYMDAGNLKSGIYFIQFIFNEGMPFTTKVVKVE